MGEIACYNRDCRIEVSGWRSDNTFFVEKTELLSTETGEKKLLLHHFLPNGAMVFIRLLATEHNYSSVPVTYQVEDTRDMDAPGLYEIRLQQILPREKAALTVQRASNVSGNAPGVEEGVRCIVRTRGDTV